MLKIFKNVVKTGCFVKRLRWRPPVIFEMKEGVKPNE